MFRVDQPIGGHNGGGNQQHKTESREQSAWVKQKIAVAPGEPLSSPYTGHTRAKPSQKRRR